VGTAFDGRSLVWFTISHGIVDEVYYPRVDQANTRDMGLLVTEAAPSGGASPFFSEEKRDTSSEVHLLGAGVPGYRLVNTCADGRYVIEKTIITDPERDVLLQRIRFRPLVGELAQYRVYVLLAPHIGNQGYGNDGWADDYKGIPMLFAQRGDVSLALSCSAGWLARTCGFVGVNDGWRQLRAHGRIVNAYAEARRGNIALTGEVDLASGTRVAKDDGRVVSEFTIALGFGASPAEAAQRVRMSLASTFERVEQSYVAEWSRFHEHTLGPVPGASALQPEVARQRAARDVGVEAGAEPHRTHSEAGGVQVPANLLDLYRMSAAVLASHEDKRASGALIASLSIPWGQSRGDHELGGYHLVWPRDLVESAGGLIAAGHCALARRTLRYLLSTQEADGRWAQNLWLDGTPYWRGVQMDETAFPILFAELLRRAGELRDIDPWPMIRAAAGFLVAHGPVTEQDRWEEDGGYSPFTLAVEIAALVVAAEFARSAGETAVAQVLLETADAWNDSIERWTYVTGTEFARLAGVDGYYARIAPGEDTTDGLPLGYVPIRNRPTGADRAPFANVVSPDALALVRFGLRAADDERILNTVRVIDSLLRRETTTGPIWYRYNNDGYGEHADGNPFDGVGIGRGWPLLAGERAHYELAAGNVKTALRLLAVMRAQASDGGLLPEQVWDADDIPERELWNGRPTGSAMPLVWAHAEYAKLVRSLHDGRVFDLPAQAHDRYVRERHPARHAIWSRYHKTRSFTAGVSLRVQTTRPAVVHWSADEWRTTVDSPSRETGLGVWITDLDTASLAAGTRVRFTLFWPDEQAWLGRDYEIVVG
jgi:glucoamylase